MADTATWAVLLTRAEMRLLFGALDAATLVREGAGHYTEDIEQIKLKLKEVYEYATR